MSAIRIVKIRTSEVWAKYLKFIERNSGMALNGKEFVHMGTPESYPCMVVTVTRETYNKEGKFKRIYFQHAFVSVQQAKDLIKVDEELNGQSNSKGGKVCQVASPKSETEILDNTVYSSSGKGGSTCKSSIIYKSFNGSSRMDA